MKLVGVTATATAAAITALASISAVAAAAASSGDLSSSDRKLVVGANGERRIRGLDPALSSRYPSPDNIVLQTVVGGPTFRCLDGSATLPASAVNDDYCDCADGSDEPGTSACSASLPGLARKTFYCANEGHVPARIFASRVNDGICEPECCDGSDEFDDGAGRCPNVCERVGREYRARRDALAKTRRTGAKIRSSYISHAVSERARLVSELEALEREVEAKRDAVQAAKTRLERLESASAAQIERRKQSALYQSLLQHRDVLVRLKRQAEQSERELETLRAILGELERGYNPNYQDMAVKAAVVGWQEYMGKAPPPGGDDEGAQDVKAADEGEKADDDDEPLVSSQELYDLEKLDTVALLLADDDDGATEVGGADGEGGDGGGAESTLYRIDQYIPDALYAPYEQLRDQLLLWLIRLGIIGGDAGGLASTGAGAGSGDGAHTSEARNVFNDAQRDLTSLENSVSSTRSTLDRLASGEYGPQAEWKKLENTCITKEQGDYTYELCWLGRATQKSNRDGASHHLGTFFGWNQDPTVDKSSETYYSKQLYNRGLKCWNGPERSVSVDLSCGLTNEILSISEPEKCEYHFTATTPALCWPDAEAKAQAATLAGSDADRVKDEL